MDARASLQAKLRGLRDARSGEAQRKVAQLQGGDMKQALTQLIPDPDARDAVMCAAERGDQSRAMELAQAAILGAPDSMDGETAAALAGSSDDEEAPPPIKGVPQGSEVAAAAVTEFRPRCEQQTQQRKQRRRRKASGSRGRRR